MKAFLTKPSVAQSDFPAPVDMLQSRMDACGTARHPQGQLLDPPDLLAPMHPETTNLPQPSSTIAHTMKNFILSSALFFLSAGTFANSLSVSVVDKEGKPVPDAVVIVLPANKSAVPALPLATQATIVQEKMQFLPNVTLVPVGAKLTFVNNDTWDHHVRSSPAGMGQFNATQAGFEFRLEGKSAGKPARSVQVALDKPGALSATLLGCFIHGSMRGFVYASESPWAAKTNADGVANFDSLPVGAAQVKVWQADQVIDLPPQSLALSTSPSKLAVQLSVVPRRPRVVTYEPGY